MWYNDKTHNEKNKKKTHNKKFTLGLKIFYYFKNIKKRV